MFSYIHKRNFHFRLTLLLPTPLQFNLIWFSFYLRKTPQFPCWCGSTRAQFSHFSFVPAKFPSFFQGALLGAELWVGRPFVHLFHPWSPISTLFVVPLAASHVVLWTSPLFASAAFSLLPLCSPPPPRSLQFSYLWLNKNFPVLKF